MGKYTVDSSGELCKSFGLASGGATPSFPTSYEKSIDNILYILYNIYIRFKKGILFMEENKKSFTYSIYEVQRVRYHKTFDEDFAAEIKKVVLDHIKDMQNLLKPEVIKANFPYITPEYICLWNNFDFDLMKTLVDFYFLDINEQEIMKLCEENNYDYAAVRAASQELIAYIREDIYTSADEKDNDYKEVILTEVEEEYCDLNEDEEEEGE